MSVRTFVARISTTSLVAAGIMAAYGLAAHADLTLESSPAAVAASASATGTARPFLLDQTSTPAADAPAQPPKAADPAKQFPSRTWELPPVQVVGQKQPELQEEELIGTHAQPRWTAHRRFTAVRSYVIPENEVEFEYWVRANIPRKGPTELNQMQELEVGLPYRFQMDIYLIERTYGTDGYINLDEAIEFRWALADWGKIWGNPAFYIEYMHRENDPDKLEFKFLLTDELAPRWHWSANAVWEHETGGEMTNTYELTLGLSYTAIDNKLSLGGEIKAALNDVHDDRGHFAEEFYIGPSVQWRPMARMHVDLAPLIGLTGHSDGAQVFFIVGYEF